MTAVGRRAALRNAARVEAQIVDPAAATLLASRTTAAIEASAAAIADGTAILATRGRAGSNWNATGLYANPGLAKLIRRAAGTIECPPAAIAERPTKIGGPALTGKLGTCGAPDTHVVALACPAGLAGSAAIEGSATTVADRSAIKPSIAGIAHGGRAVRFQTQVINAAATADTPVRAITAIERPAAAVTDSAAELTTRCRTGSNGNASVPDADARVTRLIRCATRAIERPPATITKRPAEPGVAILTGEPCTAGPSSASVALARPIT